MTAEMDNKRYTGMVSGYVPMYLAIGLTTSMIAATCLGVGRENVIMREPCKRQREQQTPHREMLDPESGGLDVESMVFDI